MKRGILSILWLCAIVMGLHAAEVKESKIAPPEKDAKSVPSEINYQGWLGSATDTTGITDTLGMIFRLYTTPTGGSPVWSEPHMAVPVDKGIFNVLLGSGTSLPLNIFTGNTLWIEVQVTNDTLSPRQKLVSVGYAIKSEISDNATYADTAAYSSQSGSDNDWEIYGSDMYSAVSGNVGIGMTSPGYKLDVAGAVNATAFRGDGSQLTNVDCPNWYGGGSVSADLWRTGNVGVGVSNPSARLHLVAEDSNNNGPTSVLKLFHFGSSPADGIATRIHMTTSSGPSTYRDAAYIDAIMSDLSSETSALSFWTRNSGTMGERVRIDGAGKVGIGTTEPMAPLEVYSSNLGIPKFGVGDLYGWHFEINADGKAGVLYGDATKPSYAFRQDWDTGMFRATYNTLGFSTAGNERVRINSSGNVGIGTTSPSHLLDVGTSGAYCNGGAWVDGSSKEYKENIAELSLGEAVNAVKKLVPVIYNYKANTDEKYVGFVAEDVPELVAMKDRKGLSPMDIVAVLTKVVQEQQKKIELLEAKQKELEELKAKLDKLTK